MARSRAISGYRSFLAAIKERILHSRITASRAVNRELVLLYWDIGRGIVEKQQASGWGDAVVVRLSKDLLVDFPGMRGFSVANLWRMQQFYLSHTSPEFLSQVVREIGIGKVGREKLSQIVREFDIGNAGREKLSQAVRVFDMGKSGREKLSQAVREINLRKPGAEKLSQAVREINVRKPRRENLLQAVREMVALVPWGHHANVLAQINDAAERIYYIRATAQLGWSRDVLINQVKAGAYERAVKEKKTNNFALALPEHFAEQADEMMKNCYNLEFLGVNKAIKERQLENRLVSHLQNFILELGYGFCFVGRQYRLVLGSKEYFVDLLFYHRFLKALVAFDLKIGSFEPEHTGKMDFYLNLLNEKERGPHDNPSVGIILCAEKNDIEVEFALKTKQNPIGVAEYFIQKKLPGEFKGHLPSAKQLSAAVRDIFCQKVKRLAS